MNARFKLKFNFNMRKNALRALTVASVAVMAVAGAWQAQALTSAHYTTTSQLSRGKWVKVRVTTEGIQQITYQQLRDWGFSDPTKVRAYGYGGRMLGHNRFLITDPDDVTATPTIHTDDGRLLFYGENDVRASVDIVQNNRIYLKTSRNHYALGGYYMLSDAQTGLEPEPAAPKGEDSTTPQQWHIATQLHECEVQNRGQGSSIFHGYPRKDGDQEYITFNIYDFDPLATGGQYPYGYMEFTAAARYKVSNSYYTLVMSRPDALSYPAGSNNGSGAVPIRGLKTETFHYDEGTGWLNFEAGEGKTHIDNGKYTFQLSYPVNSSVVYRAFDKAYIAYPRTNRMIADSSEIVMQCVDAIPGEAFRILDATASTRIFNVTDPSRVFEYTAYYDDINHTLSANFNGTHTSSDPARLVAFDVNERHHDVDFVGDVPNQNIHGQDTPTMVIITNDELLPYAQQLADAHNANTIIDQNVVVFTQQQVFNEFSSGAPSATAYRRLAKMFYDRDQVTFKYLLIYGKGLYDNRGVEIKTPYERMMVYEVEKAADGNGAFRHSSLNFASDNYYGMLDDNFNPDLIQQHHVQIAVGRIPASNGAEAADVNKKLIRVINNPATIEQHLRALITSDDGDQNAHLNQSQSIGEGLTQSMPAVTIFRGHNSLYDRTSGDNPEVRKLIRSAFAQGVGFFDYAGHGRPDGFTGEALWTQSYAKSTKYSCMPFAVIASCDTYNVDRPTEAISQTMVMQPDGGVLAAVAACRQVYLDYNHLTNLSMARAYAMATPSATVPPTVGDIYKTGHNMAVNSTHSDEARRNILCYNLCGDPAIPIVAANTTVRFTQVNDSTLNPVQNPTVPQVPRIVVNPMSTLNLKGFVQHPGYTDALPYDLFNGTATVTLYDNVRPVSVIKKDNADNDFIIRMDQSPLATVIVPVKEGYWEASMLVPYNTFCPEDSNRVCRVVVSAVSDNNKIVGAGVLKCVAIDGDPSTPYTGAGPQITEMYLDEPDFADGDDVDNTTIVHATIAVGGAGISISDGIGAASRLTLDGSRNIEGAARSITMLGDGTASFMLPVSDLADGRHTLTLSIADNAGNRDVRTLAFNVRSNPVHANLSTDVKTAVNSVTIDLSHDFSADEAVTANLLIDDASGRTVLVVNNASFPYVWNLRDAGGIDLPDGHYTAYARLTGSNHRASTPRHNITVVR